MRRLRDQQDRAAPFAAETHGLEQPQHDEEDWRPDADLLIGRQQAHQERAKTHQHHRKHEHRFAPDAVAEMTEDDAAQRARNIAQRVDAQCRKRADRWIRGREEKRPKDQRSGAGVDKKNRTTR